MGEKSGMQLNLWQRVPAPCLDVCGENNEGDESRVGRQHPRCPLMMGRWQPLPGSGGVWVTACLILLFFPPNCSLHPWCHHHIKGIEN